MATVQMTPEEHAAYLARKAANAAPPVAETPEQFQARRTAENVEAKIKIKEELEVKSLQFRDKSYQVTNDGILVAMQPEHGEAAGGDMFMLKGVQSGSTLASFGVDIEWLVKSGALVELGYVILGGDAPVSLLDPNLLRT